MPVGVIPGRAYTDDELRRMGATPHNQLRRHAYEHMAEEAGGWVNLLDGFLADWQRDYSRIEQQLLAALEKLERLQKREHARRRRKRREYAQRRREAARPKALASKHAKRKKT